MGLTKVILACAFALLFLTACPPNPSGTGLVLTDVLHQDGGDLVNAECPSGKYLVGFSGSVRPNEWLTRIDIACGRWNGFSFVDVTSTTAFGPGGGGGYSAGGCSSASAIKSVVVSIHAPNGNVRRLDGTCWNMFDIGDASFIVGIETPPGITLGAAECPLTHRAVGMRGRVNAEGVDGLGLMCRPKP